MRSPRIALVSCVKSKLATAARAVQLYTSPWFRACRRYAERYADEWYILSAEYGVLCLEQIVTPYERSLNRVAAIAREIYPENDRSRKAFESAIY